MSDDDYAEIRKLVSKIIRNMSVVFNGMADPDHLPEAIARAVAEAIKYYDEHRF